MKKRVVVVDDDPGILQTAKIFLSSKFSVTTCSSPDELMSHLKGNKVDILILDMNFKPGATDCQEGMETLRHVLKVDSRVAVIMNTAFGDIDVAVQAIQEGAIDFLVKPWDSDTLLKKVNNVLEKLNEDDASEVVSKRRIQEEYQFKSSAPAMLDIYEYVKKVAPTVASVLLMGDNGTGKTLLAYQIHQLSKRKDGPFIKVDLGAIPETLFEAELFGHVKGAFTDAKEDKTGKFEMASGGTLFLDEITNLSFALQSKILSAIQFQRVSKIGSNLEKELDIRLICATNQPIYELSDEGKFRRDLLYRVNTIEITLPPLQERIEDVEFFSHHFMEAYVRSYDKPSLNLSKHALGQLQRHTWPGNIRELQHVIERAVILCDGTSINPEHIHLGPGANHTTTNHPLQTDESIPKMMELEKETIINALNKTGGNLSKAARELGLGRTTLYRKMQKLNIPQ
jgi:DNA-binding NtrC family response regulator